MKAIDYNQEKAIEFAELYCETKDKELIQRRIDYIEKGIMNYGSDSLTSQLLGIYKKALCQLGK